MLLMIAKVALCVILVEGAIFIGGMLRMWFRDWL